MNKRQRAFLAIAILWPLLLVAAIVVVGRFHFMYQEKGATQALHLILKAGMQKSALSDPSVFEIEGDDGWNSCERAFSTNYRAALASVKSGVFRFKVTFNDQTTCSIFLQRNGKTWQAWATPS